MKNSSKIIIVLIVVLVIAIGVTAFLNRGNIEEKKQLIDNAEFVIMQNGKEVITYDMKQISSMGEINFKANLKKDGKAPIEYKYTGVLLKDILKEAGIKIDETTTVTVSAADGYAVAVDVEKLLQDDNIYLAYKREGELIGTKESGGKGPYQMIISKDQFSQYWCKFAISVDVN